METLAFDLYLNRINFSYSAWDNSYVCFKLHYYFIQMNGETSVLTHSFHHQTIKEETEQSVTAEYKVTN